jgi:predicted phosphodiesterase
VGKLADLLNQPTAREVEQSSSFDGDGNYVQSRVLDRQPATPHELLELFGHDTDRFALSGPARVSHRELADGRVLSTYSYRLLERPQAVDISDLVSQVGKAKKHRENPAGGPHWFVFQAGDLQIGKRSRDGATEQIVERYLQSVDSAVQEFKFLRKLGIDGIQISMPGDCLEGVVSQGGKNAWLTQETITEQTRIFRRLMLATVEAFAPLTDKVYLDVVNGNHDEAQRQWNTYPGDGWATECAIAVSDALTMNPDAYGHVEVRVPDKWAGHMTVPVGDSIVTVAHGHQWSRNQGMRWWADQSLNKQNPAHAHVLQHGHIHTYELETTRDRTRVSSPTLDCGSDWFREVRGGDSKRGCLVYLLAAGETSRLSVV